MRVPLVARAASRRVARWWAGQPGPVVVVVATVAFGAWHLQSELDPVHYLHDGSFHLAYLGWARDRLAAGDSPLDGIFTPLGLGFPVFQHYQVLPYLLTAPVALVVGVQDAYVGVLYLLLVLWPACVYVSVRLMEFDRWVAAGAAVAAPFVMSASGYGFELGSYVWRGSGMWTQAWGMWFFALALATGWRAIYRGRSLALAAVLLAATLTSHVLTGLLTAAVLLAWGLVAARPVRSGLGRAGAVVAGGGLASAWLFVPSWVDRRATYFDNPPGTTWSDSFGVRQVLSWLWRGELFDRDRWPVLTVLAAVGLVVLARRAVRSADEGVRAVLVLTAVSLVLFFGATAVGPVVDRLPGREMLFLHRMVVGVHFGGLVLAGAGGATVARALARAVSRGTAAASRRLPGVLESARARTAVTVGIVGALAVVALAPAWTQVRSYLGEQDRWIADQRRAESTDGRDFAALVGVAAAQGGRVSAGTRGAGGDEYLVGYVPAYIELLNLGADGVGFTGRVPALTEPSEARYNGTAVGQSEAFDVRWHLRAAGVPGPAGGRVVATRGRHVLWEVETTGPVAMVDTTAALRADRSDVALVSAPFFNSGMPLDGRFPVLALDGVAGDPPTLASEAVDGPAGTVSSVVVDDLGDSYSATVTARRDAALLVKTSYHPRWVAEVDGRSAPVVAVAPGLTAVEVPAGRHDVTVRFAGFPLVWRLGLVAAGAAGIAGLWLVDRGRLRFPSIGRVGGRRRLGPVALVAVDDPPDTAAGSVPSVAPERGVADRSGRQSPSA